MRRIVALCLALFSLGAAPVAAQGLGERLFGGKSTCFARAYTADHLASHPLQQVTEITLRPDVAAMRMGGEVEAVMISVRRRADSETYFGSAYCDRTGAALTCYREGDAGSFKLTEAANGALRLEVGPNGMSFEGSADFVTLEANRGDDRVFLIPPAPCPF